MTRTDFFKLLYASEIFAVGGAAVFVLRNVSDQHRVLVFVVAAVVLLIPGRIQGALFRQHFRGRRLMDAGMFRESIAESEAFIETLQRQSWRKRAIWLAGFVYSPDIEAMTWNNIGVAASQLGDWDWAERCFRRALEIDVKYPIPHANLAVVQLAKGNEQIARQEVTQAVALGYRGTSVDQALRKAQSILARIESTGPERLRT